MPVILKHIFTRPSLHDLYWFELQLANIDSIQEFEHSATKFAFPWLEDLSWNTILDQKDQLRPDIAQMITNGTVQSIEDLVLLYAYDPTSVVTGYDLVFDSIEKCREANQNLFDASGLVIEKLAKETNNTIRNDIYDELGNFLEHGIFDIK